MARGYILLEAVIGGALVGTVLIGLFGHIGDAQAESTRQARLITAEQLAMKEIEEQRIMPYSNVVTRAPYVATTSSGRYTVSRTIVDATERVRTSTDLNMLYKTVTVVVAFPDRTGVRDVAVQTRIYRE
jgi:hypothetical protein